MLAQRSSASTSGQRGMSLIEVLVTILILAFGLLGLAGVQTKYNVGLMESYQRAQAVVLLGDLAERINANSKHAADYVSANTYGTGDSQPVDCNTLTPPITQAARDLCEWSNTLKGAAETKNTTNVGAMIGARGCVTQIQSENSTPTVCVPGIYQVTVAWQGMHPTKESALDCGKNQYGSDDKYRHAISTIVTVGLPSCN